MHTEVEKYVEEIINAKLGLEYAALESVSIRLGYNSSPGTMTFGFSIVARDKLYIDADAQYNNLLGVNPSLGLRYVL